MGLGLDLGGVWAPFGEAFGRSGPSCAHFGPLWGRLGDVVNHFFFKHGTKVGSKRPLASILGGFGTGMERFWEGLGRIWTNFVAVF